MSKSYRKISIYLTKKQAASLQLKPKAVWQKLLELKREALKKQRQVKIVAREEYQRQYENLRLKRRGAFVEDELEEEYGYRIPRPVVKPKLKPRFKPKSQRKSHQFEKPYLYVDPKLNYRHDKQNTEVVSFDVRDKANLKLVGQNPQGYTNYTPNISVVVNEQAGEIVKPIGQGQQDRLEYRHDRVQHSVEIEGNRHYRIEHESPHQQDALIQQRRLAQKQFENQYETMRRQAIENIVIQRQEEERLLLEEELLRQNGRSAAPAA